MDSIVVEIPVEIKCPVQSDCTVQEEGIHSDGDSTSVKLCRICHETTNEKRNPLVSPCLCKGSLEFVHRKCLERWLTESSQRKCDICQFPFIFEEKLRYSCLESAILWFSRPENRTLLLVDLCFCIMLSLICIFLLTFGSAGLFSSNGQGDSPQATIYIRVVSSLFLILLGGVYLINMCLLIQGQIKPWYRWWRSCRAVRILERVEIV